MEPNNTPNPTYTPAPETATPTTPINSPSPMTTSTVHHRKVGPIMLALIVILAVIFSGLYLFASYISRENTNTPTPTTNASPAAAAVTNTNEAAVSVPTIDNTSDDPQSLSNDLQNATNGMDESGL